MRLFSGLVTRTVLFTPLKAGDDPYDQSQFSKERNGTAREVRTPAARASRVMACAAPMINARFDG